MTKSPGPRFAEALAYARELHSSQKRKGTEIPYIAHLLAVAAIVLEHGGDEDQAIAALLHDGPEDQGGIATLEEIERRFGRRVSRIVANCTDTLEKPKPAWKLRKARYIERVRKARTDDFLLVSLADKVHNLDSIRRDHESLGARVWKRFKKSKEKTLSYYESLYEAYSVRMGKSHPTLLRELRRSLDELLGRSG
jgi:(p)ppGpp synthase/HD superfamily hydrolase